MWEKWTPANSSFFIVGIRFLAEAIECMDVPLTKKEKIGRGSGSMGEEVKKYGLSLRSEFTLLLSQYQETEASQQKRQ